MTVHVFLVDDEKTVRTTMAAYLEDEGFDVTQADSGEEAVTMAEKGLRANVCIMDMRLPGMDGHDAILALHERLPEVRFLIHTGSLSYVLTDDLREIGIGEHALFRKPLQDMSVLAEAVRALAAEQAPERCGNS